MLTDSQRKAAEGKTPKAKATKAKGAPKRALSAYMFFSQDWRERIKTENPDAGFGRPAVFLPFSSSDALFIGEVGKLLGAKWKELDEEEKQVHSSHLTNHCRY